jgi:hypothetical protein
MAGSEARYDEGGTTFYFFLLTLLSMYLVPTTIGRLCARTYEHTSTSPRALALTRRCGRRSREPGHGWQEAQRGYPRRVRGAPAVYGPCDLPTDVRLGGGRAVG